MEGNELFSTFNGDKRIAIWKRIKVNPYLTPYTKIKPRWIKDLNVESETVKEKKAQKAQNFFENFFL